MNNSIYILFKEIYCLISRNKQFYLLFPDRYFTYSFTLLLTAYEIRANLYYAKYSAIRE